jgi:hypothetical protein
LRRCSRVRDLRPHPGGWWSRLMSQAGFTADLGLSTIPPRSENPCCTSGFSSVGPPGLEPGTYGLKVHAQAETMTSEAYIHWDSGLTASYQALPQTPFRVTFDVTRRLGCDRQWLPLTVGPRTSGETDRALPAAGRLGAGEPLLRGAQPGIVQVEELRYPDAELVHLLHRGLKLRRLFLASPSRASAQHHLGSLRRRHASFPSLAAPARVALMRRRLRSIEPPISAARRSSRSASAATIWRQSSAIAAPRVLRSSTPRR